MLGSSQMREAFLMTLAGAALYGLDLFHKEHRRRGLVWVFAALLVGLPISSLFAVLLIVILALMMIVMNRGRIFRSWRFWTVLGIFLVIGLAGIWFMGDQILPEGAANPVELISRWLRYAAQWDAYTTERSSGWIQKIFSLTPDWMHGWLLLGYGIVQPFFPAALVATGNPLWRIIALWRSIGWTCLLFGLAYVPFRSMRLSRDRWLVTGFSLVAWFGVLLSAYRGGGDQWDNPRYRVTFIVLQAALLGWVWAEHRREFDPWLRRVVVGVGLVIAWFIPWYVRRYYPQVSWPVSDLFKTFGLGLVSAILFLVWDLVRSE